MSSPKIPYPPSPTDVPEGLTDYADSYTKQQNLLLAGLFVFLIFYIGAIILFAMVGVWCALTWKDLLPVKIAGMAVCGTFFLYLVKGFFKRHPMNKEMHIEITEDEHPVLFGFIHQLCEELGAPEPNKVFVSPDVNAAVMPRTSLVNLFVEPKKDLLIGLGLVNCVNLTEFKAVLAHEFGHFSQSAMASSYTYIASRIIADLVEGEDWFDRFISWCKRQENGAAKGFGYFIGACLWVGRSVLEWLYKAITLQRLAVSREREFHADLVAVSAAGSNAVAHCLLRTEFGHQCFMQAIDDLATCLDHKLYSNDLYLHQDRAAIYVRRKKKEHDLGMPPALKGPNDGAKIQVFDPDEEEMNEDIPPMWRTHPVNSEREANAKEQFVPAVADHRSPWILFDNPAELRERMSYKFYRMVFRVPKNTDLTEAQKVQEYIDNEHAETTYDPKYQGAYDDRPLEPGDLSELNGIIADSPWTEERMEKVYEKLFDGCKEHADAHSELHKELYALREQVVGKPTGKMKRMIQDVEGKLDENWEWFKSFDRRVYLLHVQMAMQVDSESRNELVERYRFQLEVQRLYQESRHAFNEAQAYLNAFSHMEQPSNDFISEVLAVLRKSWKSLKNIIKDAREINLPAMKNFEEGERLADFILEGKLVPEPPLSGVKGVWIDKLMTQLNGVKNKCFRLHFKSVGGILSLQEKIAAAWNAARTPVASDVESFVSDAEEVVVADVVDAEPARVYTSVDEIHVVPFRKWDDDAEVLEAEVVSEPGAAGEVRIEAIGAPGEFTVMKTGSQAAAVPAPLSLDEADVIEAEVLEEPPAAKPMAAFVPAADNPFSFDPAPSPPVPPPAAAKPAAPPPTEPEPVFSFDPDPEPAKPAAPPAKPAPPPAKPPVPAEEVFSLDADENAAGQAGKAAPLDLFTLDADELAAAKAAPPAKPAPKSAASDPEPVAAEEVFSLDADAIVEEPAPVKSGPDSLSGSTAVPAPRAVFAAEVAPAAVVTEAAPETNGTAHTAVEKPAAGRRPALRITFVKPGEKSPIGK
jgi:Zn-dependent protease with chaperone function